MMGSCGRCTTTWEGSKIEHCSNCCQTFTGTASGDKHRVGKHHVVSGPERRRCLSVDEMVARGMVQNGRGVWMTAAMPDSRVRPTG